MSKVDGSDTEIIRELTANGPWLAAQCGGHADHGSSPGEPTKRETDVGETGALAGRESSFPRASTRAGRTALPLTGRSCSSLKCTSHHGPTVYICLSQTLTVASIVVGRNESFQHNLGFSRKAPCHLLGTTKDGKQTRSGFKSKGLVTESGRYKGGTWRSGEREAREQARTEARAPKSPTPAETMNPNVSGCCVSLLLLLHLVGAKPLSDLQSLKRLLEEELNAAPYYSSSSSEEEVQVEAQDGGADKAGFGAAGQPPWDSSDPGNSALAAKDNVLARLFKDLTRTSKRSWSRYKKGGLRSCFGVRLDRIGSFSGLGC